MHFYISSCPYYYLFITYFGDGIQRKLTNPLTNTYIENKLILELLLYILFTFVLLWLYTKTIGKKVSGELQLQRMSLQAWQNSSSKDVTGVIGENLRLGPQAVSNGN